MQRFINNPDDVVDEIVKGYLLDNRALETLPNNFRVVKRKKIPKRVTWFQVEVVVMNLHLLVT